MTKRTTRSTVTRADGRAPTGADRAQQRHLDRQLEGEAQRLSDETEEIADDMRSGMWDWLRLIGLAVVLMAFIAVAVTWI